MPKTTEKPDRALSRTIPDSWWNSEARFALDLCWKCRHSHPNQIRPAIASDPWGADFTRRIHYAACFLPKIASALSRLDCEACNRELSDREEKRRERLDRDAEAIARSIGASAVRQRDPRGMPLYLNFPGMVDESQPDWRYQTNQMLAVPVK